MQGLGLSDKSGAWGYRPRRNKRHKNGQVTRWHTGQSQGVCLARVTNFGFFGDSKSSNQQWEQNHLLLLTFCFWWSSKVKQFLLVTTNALNSDLDRVQELGPCTGQDWVVSFDLKLCDPVSPHIKVQDSLALSFLRGRVLPLKLQAGSMGLPVVTHNVIWRADSCNVCFLVLQNVRDRFILWYGVYKFTYTPRTYSVQWATSTSYTSII
jgi:hypothetical protein